MRLHVQTDEAYREDDINLSSFDVHSRLNPEIWNGDEMRPEIRRELLILARDFIDEMGLDYVHPENVIVTGSIANFNWDKTFSDIDLHILVDFSKTKVKPEILKKFFDLQKKEWNRTHEDISIKGFPVEIYVQDTKEKHASTGVYSILDGEWLKTPSEKEVKPRFNRKSVKKSAVYYINKIDELADSFKKDKSEENIERIYNDSIELFDEIKAERQNGMKTKHPEMSNGNIVFKVLRRTEYINKLLALRTKCYDILHTIK